LEYLRKTRFAEGDRASAEAQARSIAHYLKQEYGASRVVGIGSLFSSHKVFKPGSDIDLIAAGIPPDAFLTESRAFAGWLRAEA
jgi:predicted nucleotidyltransferase